MADETFISKLKKMSAWQSISVLLCVMCWTVNGYPGEEKRDMGTLEGDVQNWAMLIQNYILQLASDGIKRDFSQSYLDQASYTKDVKNGSEIVVAVKESLGAYFEKKKIAARRLADKVKELYDNFMNQNITGPVVSSLPLLPQEDYSDSDIPGKLPSDLTFTPNFRQKVSWKQSTVKIADEVPRGATSTINSIHYTAALDEVFKQNRAEDETLRWQYFGSSVGIVRIYPGREWSTNFAGFYNDYDPRVRPWYIAATSGPKDVVIILDCSLSMAGEKFAIAKGVAKTVINTLTKQDYVNVICARASHWDEVGKWKYFSTDVLSCQTESLVEATIAHRKDLIEKINKLKAGGTSELEKGFDIAYDLLMGNARTGCQSVIVFATDGQEMDGENVRCGPGYYTRSGYVPGPVCKYNWTKVYTVADEKRKYSIPEPRIFSYLIKDPEESFPGTLACSHRGSLIKLMTGESLISQMNNYFEFLFGNAKSTKAFWTSPYLDAWDLGIMVTHAIPVLSSDGKNIGVVGVDATLDEIENYLTKHQWGTVYSFLINNKGEAIYHPRLKPSTNLLEDPIFIPISQLETDIDRNPAEFSLIEQDMRQGNTSYQHIPKSKDGKARTYYYGALNESEYSFAYSLADTDMVFRRSQEPTDRSKYPDSVFNLLKEYRGNKSRERLGNVAEEIEIKEAEEKYPGLRISYKHSTIFLPAKAYCDPISYLYDDDLEQKTIDAHEWINSKEPDNKSCGEPDQKFNKGIRTDVLITQPIEDIWRNRSFESLNQVKWTNIGLRSGVFRTYPGHRSTRGYDPTKRPWYKRTSSAPWKTSISTPYMDAAGVGKINTISQAVFEGMTPRTQKECLNISKTGPWPGGCKCNVNENCISRECYISMARGPNRDKRRCATERVEGVTGLDILYDDFHQKAMGSMQASDFRRSCGQNYTCPDNEPGCLTRCYLFDSDAFLVMDPEFMVASDLEENKYVRVQLGTKEGEVMKDLIYRHKFFIRNEGTDFQGSCRITPEAPKVTLAGIPKNPEEKDDYTKNKGPIPKFNSEFGCIQDLVGFKANDTALGPSGMLTGNVSGPCMSGFYYVIALPKTNLYLLVIENWNAYKATLFYNFNCKITRSIVNSGAYRIINGTCAHEDKSTSTLAQQGRCPATRDLVLPCKFVSGASSLSQTLFVISVMMILLNWCTCR
ncbi:LOW QUALITY PROTEIN: voltage-dependent calcium channel subunit alpha-2/delta-2-like [Argopecten irradians]|uniref:LOW QUALITY PROTEIN: voltage-dependent calcium channel subunit alpha-2/delta-2-like n=1 Tax=Argopecten irradians TaxID=31199 RepID=UPI0037197D17